jgi:hypothetical protein
MHFSAPLVGKGLATSADKKGMVVDTNGRKDLEKKIEKLLAE